MKAERIVLPDVCCCCLAPATTRIGIKITRSHDDALALGVLAVSIVAAAAGSPVGVYLHEASLAVPSCRRCWWHLGLKHHAGLLGLVLGLAALVATLMVPISFGFVKQNAADGTTMRHLVVVAVAVSLVTVFGSFFLLPRLAPPGSRCGGPGEPLEVEGATNNLYRFRFTNPAYGGRFAGANGVA